jgi:hypothetical protein
MLYIGFCLSLEAQSDAALEYIRSKTNVESLNQKAREWRVRDSIRYAEAVAKALEKGWPIRTEDSTGVTEIAFLDDNGSPVYRTTTNTNAAISTQTNLVHSGGGAGYDLNGDSILIGEWDGGGVLTSHEILTGRVEQKDSPGATNFHATHVAGTLIGSDAGNSGSKGMAPEASLNAYDWNFDNSEMADEAEDGLLISNHSYGYITGWRKDGNDWEWWGDFNLSNEEDWNFGRYDNNAVEWDDIAFDAPFYLIVKSAGNDRGDGPPPVGEEYFSIRDGNTYVFDPTNNPNFSPPQDGGADGFDCLPRNSNAKNILTIGAVFDVLNYNDPNDVSVVSFSGWGPADDGRIKPDLVGNGVWLYSSDDDNNSDYTYLSGTSMSGPNVAGSLLLLQQLYMELNNDQAMRAATLKGLAIHTARPTGDGPAPDYKFGWGLLSTRDAADLISDASGNDSLIMEMPLVQNDNIEYTYVADGTEPIKVTISWTDPPGTTKSGLNNREPALVNDLDLRIEHEGTTFEPYVLDVENPANVATNGDDTVNNVEQIYLEDPDAGEYIVQISHKGTIADTQYVSMITSGYDLQLLPIQWLSIEGEATSQGHQIRWEAITENVEIMEVQQWVENRFVTIGSRLPLHGKGRENYAYLNAHPRPTPPYIYRVNSIAYDGAESYSPLVLIHDDKIEADNIQVFPNPARSHWRIRSSMPISQMVLLDNRGQQLHSWSGECPTVIAAGSLMPGGYYLRLKVDEQEWITYPLIKVE